MKKNKTGNNNLNFGEILLYQTENGKTRIDVRLQDETVWLSQRHIAELYQVSIPTINEHFANIYSEGECSKATTRKFRIVQLEGSRQVERLVEHYNLEAILAVGYRVRSSNGIRFRQWATATLKEYLIKGFVINDERLKNPGESWDYFDELLERIREIRASEKRFYQKIRDIYATSVDYDVRSEQAQLFFKTVQNKMLWAVTSKTAAELISQRGNPDLPNMGLTAWQGSRVRKSDVSTAKNYLTKDEIQELNRIVTMFLDLAEDQARQHQPMTMKNWEERLDEFLAFTKRPILKHAGSISHKEAEQIAQEKFDSFDEKRRKIETLAAEKEYLRELEDIEKDIIR